MTKKELTRDNHEVLTLCYSCIGTGKKTPGNGTDKCPRCKGSGYEK